MSRIACDDFIARPRPSESSTGRLIRDLEQHWNIVVAGTLIVMLKNGQAQGNVRSSRLHAKSSLANSVDDADQLVGIVFYPAADVALSRSKPIRQDIGPTGQHKSLAGLQSVAYGAKERISRQVLDETDCSGSVQNLLQQVSS